MSKSNQRKKLVSELVSKLLFDPIDEIKFISGNVLSRRMSRLGRRNLW
jgi:hypothetical protein